MTNTVQRILVTGGAGLIGSHTIDLLIKERGFDQQGEIIAIDNLVRGRRENLSWALSHGNVKLVEGDIRDKPLMQKLIEGIDVVFHLAALRITHCAAEPRLALEVMADATFDLLELAVSTKVKKIVAASSASIYGLAEQFPTSESHHPYNNRTLYGAAKIFNEGLLRSFYEMYGLNYVALRYFNVYGPRMDIHGAYTEVLIRWMERITNGQPPLIFGNGGQTMDFVYIDDIAKANVLAAYTEVTDEVFNIARGEEVSLNQLAETLLKVMGSNLKPEYGPERKVNPVSRRLADVKKAREQLGFLANIPLETGLRELVTWWQAERNQ